MSNDNTLHSTTELPFFFILGRSRSGTTLLRNLFDAHPNVAIPTEVPFIPFTYKKFGRVKTWDDKCIHDFVVCISNFWKFRNLHITAVELEIILQQERDKTPKFSYTDVIKTIACSYPSAFPKSEIMLAGDKSPSYSLFPQLLYKIFPDAKFVAIVRDYRDVVASVKQVDFELPYTSIICIYWRFSQRQIMKLVEKHPKQFMLIRYEDFVMKPEEKLAGICDFLGVEFLPAVLDDFNQPKAMAQEFNAALFEKHHASLKAPVNTGNIDKWKRSLTDFDVRVADFFVGKWAERSGYKRLHNGFDLKALWCSIPTLIMLFLFVMIFLFTSILPSNIRGRYWSISNIVARKYYQFHKKKTHER